MATITPTLSIRNAMLNLVLSALDSGASGGTCKLYTGSKPAGPGTAITSQVLLGTGTLQKPSAVVSNGVMTFNAITQDSAADASGVAAWARFSDSNGNAVIDVDASVVGGTGFLQMNTTNIVAEGPISITSCVINA